MYQKLLYAGTVLVMHLMRVVKGYSENWASHLLNLRHDG